MAPLVPDGDDDLVVAGVDLAAQGAPHPQRLGSQLEVRLLLEYLLLNILNCKTDFWVSYDPENGRALSDICSKENTWLK